MAFPLPRNWIECGMFRNSIISLKFLKHSAHATHISGRAVSCFMRLSSPNFSGRKMQAWTFLKSTLLRTFITLCSCTATANEIFFYSRLRGRRLYHLIKMCYFTLAPVELYCNLEAHESPEKLLDFYSQEGSFRDLTESNRFRHRDFDAVEVMNAVRLWNSFFIRRKSWNVF